MKKNISAFSSLSEPREGYPSATQLDLFDSLGSIPFSFSEDVLTIPDQPGLFQVSRMTIRLSPPPKNAKWAITMTLNALASFDSFCLGRRYEYPATQGNLTIGEDEFISWQVSCRTTIDEGLITSTYSNPDIWQQIGLEWLCARRTCCKRASHNPTPWINPSCGCSD